MPFQFIPTEALPPTQLISEQLQHLAEKAAVQIHKRQLPEMTGMSAAEIAQGILPALRLLSPYGNIAGLGFKHTGSNRILLCTVLQPFIHQNNQSAKFLDILQSALLSLDVTTRFPQLTARPPRNENLLWDIHAKFASVAIYESLAVDLQIGLIASLERTGWKNTKAAQKSLDALVSGLRVIKYLPPHLFAKALAQKHEKVCGYLLLRAFRTLPKLKRGDKLMRRTLKIYFEDVCQLLNHPDWAKAQSRQAQLGAGEVESLSRLERLMTLDDDLPESADAPDGFRVEQLEKIECQVRRSLYPGSALGEIDDTDEVTHTLGIYGEELAVMKEFLPLASWNSTHPNHVAKICRHMSADEVGSLDDNRLRIRALTLSIMFTGRASDWLSQITQGNWSDITNGTDPVSTPRYVAEIDAIAYRPEAIPNLPKSPLRTADLFEPISAIWMLPLPTQLIPWWREMARRTAPGKPLFAGALEKLPAVFDWLTNDIRKESSHQPAITESRLRLACTTLLERIGQMDPLLAAFVSEQWRPSLRTPLFYTTLTPQRLAEQYRTAMDRVWKFLQTLEEAIPNCSTTPQSLPQIYFGSPYRPLLSVVQDLFAAIESAIERSSDNEARHNARLLKLLLGLSVFCGLRISEAGELQAIQVDLDGQWLGQVMSWLTLPETKSNRWTTASRKIPLPPMLLPLVRTLLSPNTEGPAFYFIYSGQKVKADAEAIRRALLNLGVPFPRWHAGRHLIFCLMLEGGLPLSVIKAILGHQSAGCEMFNFYLPNTLSASWIQYLDFTNELAKKIGWKMENDHDIQ